MSTQVSKPNQRSRVRMPIQCVCLFVVLCVMPGLLVAAEDRPLPHLQANGKTVQLIVDGKPFLMLSGELHNSSASSPEYMQPVWKKLVESNLNTVIGTASWEMIEPVEGQFDFSSVDTEIGDARKHGIKLVLIWFGTWKSASESYVPFWVKSDPKRFPKTKTTSGFQKTAWGMTFQSISPFGENIITADAKAFRALMRHIRNTDPDHTVIVVQVENEPGMFGDSRDRSAMAEAAWQKSVPSELLKYMTDHRNTLTPQLTKIWSRQGNKTSGNWGEVFGTDNAAGEIFMAWQLAKDVDAVAQAGKSELRLPMFTNGWLGPLPQMPEPGMYPSGGPVAGMLDIWRVGAPTLDFVSPNAYAPDFAAVMAQYARPDNPLFVPETYISVPNLFWAVGHHAVLGYSPFGIDGDAHLDALSSAYEAMGALAPEILKHQPQGEVMVAIEENDASIHEFEEKTGLSIKFAGDKKPATADQPGAAAMPPGSRKDDRGFALVIHVKPNEYLVTGRGFAANPSRSHLRSVEELLVERGQLKTGRRLNGDETGNGNVINFDGAAIQLMRVITYTEQ